MPELDLIAVEFCASYASTFTVIGSTGNEYAVYYNDGTGEWHCDCAARQYSRDKSCKHIEQVKAEACLWNGHYFDGNPEVKLFPDEGAIHRELIPDRTCPNCGGPVFPVMVGV